MPSDVAADVFELLEATGLRRSELCHLNRRDIHIRTVGDHPVCGTARVRPWQHGGERFAAKNETAVRAVPLTPRAALLFHQHLEAIPTEDEWQPAILSAKGRRLDPDTLSQQFREQREGLKLAENITLHSTRHGYITSLIMLRLSPYLVRDVAGHSDLRTQSRYVTFADDYLAGDAGQARKEALEFFCPGLPADALKALSGAGDTWLQRHGYASTSSLNVPIESVLFEGVLYRQSERVQ